MPNRPYMLHLHANGRATRTEAFIALGLADALYRAQELLDADALATRVEVHHGEEHLFTIDRADENAAAR